MNPRNARWPIYLAAVLGLAACATALRQMAGVHETDTILFSHAKHAGAKVECIACHETIYDAADLGGSFLPAESKCMECHKAWKDEGKCATCHAEVKFAAAWPKRTPRLQFDHARHIERTKEECTRCHSRLYEPRRDVPISDGHRACLQCHEHEQHVADAKCNSCHQDLKQYPLRPVLEFAHTGDFLKRHPLAARSASNACSTCHEQHFCLDCHGSTGVAGLNVIQPDRPDRSFVHRNDFFSRHFIEARADQVSCKRCHSPASCENCHSAQHVAAGSSQRSPHGPGWVMPGSGAAFHGDAARRDIASCAACHDQGAQSNCVSCHRVGGVGGDPHPPDFRPQHTWGEAATKPMCRVCHT